MKAGALRDWVEIESAVRTQDATTGDPVVVWTPVAVDVPAEIVPVSAREFVAGAVGPTASQITAKITIRFRPGLDATMRIKHRHDGLVDLYNIAGVLPDPRRRYLTLPVTRGVNAG